MPFLLYLLALVVFAISLTLGTLQRHPIGASAADKAQTALLTLIGVGTIGVMAPLGLLGAAFFAAQSGPMLLALALSGFVLGPVSVSAARDLARGRAQKARWKLDYFVIHHLAATVLTTVYAYTHLLTSEDLPVAFPYFSTALLAFGWMVRMRFVRVDTALTPTPL